MCALLVGLPDVIVLAVDDQPAQPLRVHVEQRVDRPRCAECGTAAWVKDRPIIELVDLGSFGRPVRLVWHKHRWCCPTPACPARSWTGQDPRIAASRLGLTDRAGRWATEQVGRNGRTVAEVARELGCDWHTVNDAVIAYGTPLVEDPARIGQVTAVGLDEVLFARQGPWRTHAWSTTLADVGLGQLLDVIPGRSAAGACRWFNARPTGWCEQIAWAVLDLSGPWRLTFDTILPWATQVADQFTFDGRASEGFRWSDPNDTRDPIEVLRGERVEFDDAGRAVPDGRLTSDDLQSLLGWFDPDDDIPDEGEELEIS
jgi:transposase